jgi:hypothetical protein
MRRDPRIPWHERLGNALTDALIGLLYSVSTEEEFALRDLINVEHHAAPYTLVAIDDIYPCHPTQAERHRRSGSWTGDIWKLHQILRACHP